MVVILQKERYWIWIVLLFLAFIGVGCGTSSLEPEIENDGAMNIQIRSTGFSDGETIPLLYTCDGHDISPDLSWSGIPDSSQALVLIMDDPDAPGGTWVHWVLYGLPGDLTELSEGAQGLGVDGVNSWRRPGYGGPCPPLGTTHRYFFKLYALEVELNLKPGATKDEVEKAMFGHILARGQMMGTYERSNP